MRADTWPFTCEEWDYRWCVRERERGGGRGWFLVRGAPLGRGMGGGGSTFGYGASRWGPLPWMDHVGAAQAQLDSSHCLPLTNGFRVMHPAPSPLGQIG
ncbi:hypothetical protein V6N11_003387 [Hibiscus sabdariffa]|uniref:Uncharacterized protein n=1 Tax=Hibiscus sabdariffa TaxID=183260 RepID=A0ABR2SDC7_9ROSI